MVKPLSKAAADDKIKRTMDAEDMIERLVNRESEEKLKEQADKYEKQLDEKDNVISEKDNTIAELMRQLDQLRK